MGYFPFFVEIKGKRGLVAGGGQIAARKVQKLLPFEPELKIVAPEILPELLENPALECNLRPFEEKDLEGCFFVIAASDDKELNIRIAKLCREKNILVNVVDEIEECGFIFPALVKEGKLTVGISTEGASPQVAADIRGKVARTIPAAMEQILVSLMQLRTEAKQRLKDPAKRTGFLREAALLSLERERPLSGEETEELYKAHQTDDFHQGSVVLAGAGCGPYDLITVRGLNAIKSAQVLVYDELLDERLLACASDSCEKIYVGKRSGKHSMSQEEINGLLIQKAGQGKRVVRLKGGDPFVFGRGGEEMLALKEAGIRVSQIPGITSAIGVPGAAGVPVTHRRVAGSFHVITGHTAEGEILSEDFKALAALNGTLIFLMGFSHLKEICKQLIVYGKAPATPAAVIQGRFDGTAFAIWGTLEDIDRKAAQSEMKTPAVIVIGEVAGMKLFGG